MRILQEQMDGEIYLELLFDEKDVEHVAEYMIPSIQFEFYGVPVNLGVRLDLPNSDFDYKD